MTARLHDDTSDVRVLRDLAKRYAELAAKPIQNQRRELWRAHNSLRSERVPILATYGYWNVWCREYWPESALECRDPFFRAHELNLRMEIWHDTVGDDYILEPWITQRATVERGWRTQWGVAEGTHPTDLEGGAWAFDPPIKEWADLAKLSLPPHVVDEAATAENVGRLQDAIGDVLEVNVDRGPVCLSFMADISTSLAGLRGLEQIMLDMCEAPDELHRLLAFMRDGILANQQAAEDAGDFSLANHANQEMPYCDTLEDPRANSGQRKRQDLWAFCAAQEFTGISPAMHEEFLLRYQIPVLSEFGLTAYGCCEDLSRKVRILRKIPNLRVIAVAPRADVYTSAVAIGDDLVASWRPNPTDMVCSAWDETKMRAILCEGVSAFEGCHMHLHLKDIETVQGDPGRLARWVRIARDVVEG